MILEVLIEGRGKQRLNFKGEKCIVGRSNKADLQLDFEGLSRKHMEIETDGKHFFVTDLNSTNGLIINGEKIPAGKKTPYFDFFPIKVGDHVTISIYPDDWSFDEEQKTSTLNTIIPVDDEPGGKSNRPRSKYSKISADKVKPASKVPTIVLGLMVLVGFYFYYEAVKPADDSNVTVIQDNTAKKKKGDFSFEVPNNNLAKIAQQAPCATAEEAKLCQLIPNLNQFEGFRITSGGIFVFIDIEKRPIDAAGSAQFAKIESPLKETIFFSSFIMKSEVIEVLKQYPYAYAVGFKLLSGKPEFYHQVAFKKVENFALTADNLTGIYAFSFNLANTRFFREIIKPSLVYKKL